MTLSLEQSTHQCLGTRPKPTGKYCIDTITHNFLGKVSRGCVLRAASLVVFMGRIRCLSDHSGTATGNRLEACEVGAVGSRKQQLLYILHFISMVFIGYEDIITTDSFPVVLYQS